MKALKTFLVVATFLLLIGPLSAHANLIWDWTGECNGVITPVHGGGSNGCSGQATLHVVTTDAYIPGEVSSSSFFSGHVTLLEWLYSDENVTVDLAPNANFDGGPFLLPASPDGEGFLSLTADFFQSPRPDGTWRFEGESLRPNCDPGIDFICGYEAMGINGVWTRVAVPEPATLALLALGFIGLVFVRRSELRDKAF